MSVRYIRFGLFQIAAHPAVTLAGLDLLQEPFSFSTENSLGHLGRQSMDLRASLNQIKTTYINWQSDRLTQLATWLQSRAEQPDFIAFPECSIPFECLPILRALARDTGITIFAGTHSPHLGPKALTVYKKQLAVRGHAAKDILERLTPPPAVMPIMTPKETLLKAKSVSSIFERTDIDRPADPVIPFEAIDFREGGPQILPLICAEALRLGSIVGQPDLVVILARERNPVRFRKYIDAFVENKIPVVLVNDGSAGGSGVFSAVDRRSLAHWWFAPPNNAQLPVGEAYIEMEIDLATRAVEVDVSNPAAPCCVRVIAPIFGADDPLHQLECDAAEAARQRNTNTLSALRSSLDKAAAKSPIVSRRWDLLEGMLASDSLSGDWLQAFGGHIVTNGLVGIEGIERQLGQLAMDGLDALIESADASSLSNELFGQVARLLTYFRKQCSATSRRGLAPFEIASTPPPIGRADFLADIRAFGTNARESAFVLLGLEAIGKSIVASTALRQSGAKVLTVRCMPGMSADFLFEYILKAVGRVPTGRPPRNTFNLSDITDALTTIDVLWLQDCHNLTDYGRFRTTALAQLVEQLVLAARDSSTRLLFESRRGFDLIEPLGLQIIRRRMLGLPNRDAVAFFEQQLRRADVSLETVSEQDRDQIAQLVDGHPGMLILCADVCAKTNAAHVIGELKAGRGFYLSAIQKLVAALELTREEHKCIEALLHCRTPIPPAVLGTIAGSDRYIAAVASLIEASVIERTPEGEVTITRLLQRLEPDEQWLSSEEIAAFHKAASKYYVSVVSRRDPSTSYQAAVEANFHAALANAPPPCDMEGMVDGLAAAVTQEFEAQRYFNVIRLLGPIASEDMPEDLLAMLAESYAWSNEFSRAFEIADQVVTKNRNYISLFTSACRAAIRSHRWSEAALAVEKASSLEPGSYLVALYKGRLSSHDGDHDQAIELFREAVKKTDRDPWPYFYLTRALVRRGRPKEALDAVNAGRQMLENRSDLSYNRSIDRALTEQELFALLLLGEDEPAQQMLDALERIPDPRPEIVVSVAYLRAFYAAKQDGSENPVSSFENALARLSRADARRAHTKAQIHYFRGRLFEELGDLAQAEEEYDRAAIIDQHNVQFKTRLLKVLRTIIRRAITEDNASAAQSAGRRAWVIVEAILSYDPSHIEAINAQSDLYHQFGFE